ncbi:MAG: pumilio domain member 6 [Piccolia ochrophora]|nr:MAG: pumilio domain member 6 [Piccolia ochrophora]
MAAIKRKLVSEGNFPIKGGESTKSKKVKTKNGSVKPAIAKTFNGDPTSSEGESDSEDFEGFESDQDKSVNHANGKQGHGDQNKAVSTSSTSKEAHAKQKALAQERRASKPNAPSIQRSKKIWERLRRKSHVPKEERQQLVAELFEIITGCTKDFVLKHDSTRVVQTAIKYGNLEQRKRIARELKGEYKSLAESKYAKFLVAKLLVHGDPETREMIIPEFYGKIRTMIKHPEASWIVDDIYRGIATPSQKATMLREWYGPEFALFKTDNGEAISSSLSDILAESPEKRAPIMSNLYQLINLLIQKKTTGFTMLHDAMLEYLLNIKPEGEQMTAFIDLIKGDEEGDLLKNLAFTKSGARVVCLALAYSSAKDRKLILRSYKDTITLLAYDPNGHLILLTAYDVIDDTVLTTKSIFPELLGKDASTQEPSILSAAQHLTARTTLLYPFTGPSKSLFSPSSSSPTDTLTFLSQIHTIRATTSKKDPAVRHAELAKTLAPPLLRAIASHAADLVLSSFGCQFIADVLLRAPVSSAKEDDDDDDERTPALAAVAALAADDPSAPSHIAHNPAAGRMLKALALGGVYNPSTKKVDPPSLPLPSPTHLHAQISPHILAWSTGPSSFVINALLEAVPADAYGKEKKNVLRVLRKGRGELEKAARGVEKEVGKDGKDAKKEGGNRGAALLLEKLDAEG